MALVAGTLMVTEAPRAAIVFQDEFDGEAAGTTFNYNAFANWDVLNGTVDFINHGGFGLSCLGGAGKCVDMDGSTNNAGDLRSKATIAAGVYEIEFWISGNQRSGPSDTITVTFGDLSESFTKAPADPFVQILRTVTVGGAGDNILFSHAGANNIGIILDRVIVRDVAIPAPASLALLGAGVIGLGVLGRRRPGQAGQAERSGKQAG